MANNRVFETKYRLHLTPTDGGLNPGDPCVVGQIPGVALQGAASTVAQAVETIGVYNFSVKGIGLTGANVAVAQGDILYYVPGNTPKLSKASDGTGAVRYGYAMDPVVSGATTTIRVIIGY